MGYCPKMDFCMIWKSYLLFILFAFLHFHQANDHSQQWVFKLWTRIPCDVVVVAFAKIWIQINSINNYKDHKYLLIWICTINKQANKKKEKE